MARDKKRWFKLDNAAKLYPAIATSRWSSVFRASVVLDEPIVPEALQRAADKVLPRFPSMCVRLRRGVFWYYLEANMKPLTVRADAGHPCMRFRWHEENGYLLRVLYYGPRISVEFFHSITDGTGGFVFLKTLAAEYLRQRGYHIPAQMGVLDLRKKPTPGEVEDAFQRMPLPRARVARRDTRAYHLPAQLEPPHTLHVIAAEAPVPPLYQLAKALGVTVTEYLTAAILYVCYQEQQRGNRHVKRPLRVSVPVNMRRFFNTETLRNCSSFINPEIHPRLGTYTFEEIVRDVHAFMRYALNPKFLFAAIATNVADERNLFLRLCPLPLKNLVIHSVFRYVGERAFTSTLTSVGRMTGPAPMMAHVRRFELMLGASATPGCNLALVTTNETITLTFTRNHREAALPRNLLRFLVERGVPITVESNRG